MAWPSLRTTSPSVSGAAKLLPAWGNRVCGPTGAVLAGGTGSFWLPTCDRRDARGLAPQPDTPRCGLWGHGGGRGSPPALISEQRSAGEEVTPGMAEAALPPRGMSPHGVSPHGVSPHGMSPLGVSPHGMSPCGVSPRGVSPRGVSPHCPCHAGLPVSCGHHLLPPRWEGEGGGCQAGGIFALADVV